ncbi:metalloregulator ArsR/SmtB family transcription factor [Paraeggerthella hongkongensis]|uniref:ArsR/SmtB family transcription factor n=1 Tax=Paraeggerthella hominis TaxID=2897351 RepID=UPI001C129048|nr:MULTISPECIES: metalloregulator ArsR/SmtB family transcription factor [Paraeggerthella]MBU5404426.1 metalloregulator ArsR/SmtB family transcription factor [Paraeggerthella hongkongensis]MCD2432122.1 metalloregulator ArsR/SmtB family transcription factor [Paraeggerthella hominis]
MGETGYALLFKALSDSNRLKIIELISKQDELCACKILDALGITQPTLSHHMKVLCSSGLVTSRRQGKWMHYSLNRETVAEVRSYIDSL